MNDVSYERLFICKEASMTCKHCHHDEKKHDCCDENKERKEKIINLFFFIFQNSNIIKQHKNYIAKLQAVIQAQTNKHPKSSQMGQLGIKCFVLRPQYQLSPTFHPTKLHHATQTANKRHQNN